MAIERYNANSYYEGLIQNYFCGADGCFVVYMQFFYQLNQVAVYNVGLVQVFRELCAIEIENCEKIAQLLIRMGGDNKYYSSVKRFLSGYNVDYVKTLPQMLASDIEILECNVIELKNIISKIENSQIKNVLKIVLENKKKELRMARESLIKCNNSG